MSDAITHYYAQVHDGVARHPRMSDRNLAALIVDAMPPHLHREILLAETTVAVAGERRIKARKIEENARQQVAAKTPEPKQVAAESKPPSLFDRLYEDPTLWRVAHDINGSHIWFNSRDRREFQKWCHGPRGGFDRWLDWALTQDVHEDFKVDFVPGYTERQRYDALAEMLNKVVEQTRFEVTAELLGTVFATGDGTRVTWGDATVLQHQDRIDMLTRMMVGTSETAAMHMKAVDMIKDAGVETLADLGSRPVP